MTDFNLHDCSIPILGFVGYSGSGKTTLLSKVIGQLSALGWRIGVLKHAHHKFDIDQPGKDSYTLRLAGAVQTMVASQNRWALITETPTHAQDPPLAGLIGQLDQSLLDLILVEGFKHSRYPKLEVHRSSVNASLLYPQDPDIIAFITDEPLRSVTSHNVPLLDLNDSSQVVQFILKAIGKQHD